MLTQVWGRRDPALGRVVHTPCTSYEEEYERLAAVRDRRGQRGYKVLGGSSMLITDTLDSVRKRAMVLGRWAPAVFYVLIGPMGRNM
jgi:hypothetical protein